MDYHAGDTVMHWVHGLGKVIRREKRDVLGHQALYYAVHVGNMIVWVPVDDKSYFRPPTRQIVSSPSACSKPGEPMPARVG
jgi:RNA polymerase-interacting CarD/CdnL/TRCF family regulator